jgi:hypothetical protein
MLMFPCSPIVKFRTDFFKPIAGEDEETNPGVYGKALARWLAEKLKERGVSVDDVFGEDSFWLVDIHPKPFRLFLGCANLPRLWEQNFHDFPVMDSAGNYDASRYVPIGGERLVEIDRIDGWGVFIAAEIPFLKRLFKRIDPTAEIRALEQHLRELVAAIPNVSDIQWDTPPA